MLMLRNRVWYNVYDDAAAAGAGAGAGASAGAGAGGGAGDGAGAGSGGSAGNTKQFTQEDVNKFLAADRRKHQEKIQNAMDELEALKTKATLTDEERTALEGRIETFKRELMTKEELAKKDREKLEKQYKDDQLKLSTERDNWKNRYVESTIVRAITDAAVLTKAFVPEQIVAIVRPMTRLVEELDSEGKPTGNLIPKVTLSDVDKTGKSVTLELSTAEAVKRMREMDRYLNLFQSEGVGGVGGITRKPGGVVDLRELAKDPVKYREARQKGAINFG
jgi:hypothetical protein